MKKIESIQNPWIKAAVKLRDRRERERKKSFLIEGYREITRALKKKVPLQALFFCPEFFLKEGEKKIVEQMQGEIACFQCAKKAFEKLSYRDRPDGLLAIASFFLPSLDSIKLSKEPLVVVAESVEKPGNLGTILRSADAAGVDLLIVCDPRTDVYNPNVVRASTGTLFTTPLVQASLTETLAFLAENKLKVCAATPKAEHIFTSQNLQGPIAIVVGSEQYGLCEKWFERADLLVKIPMFGEADSLNVAQATTLFLYEVRRQKDGNSL